VVQLSLYVAAMDEGDSRPCRASGNRVLDDFIVIRGV